MRLTENEEVLYLVMKSIEESQTPIGAGAIQRAIASRVRLSSASVGIILRDLQDQGLVVREGYRGHRLTPKGRTFLENYRNRQKKACLADRIFDYLTGSERQRLADILEARRAIETEAARLAASRAEELDLRRLGRNVEEQGKTTEARQRSLLDREFHAALLDAAHNPLLNTLFDFSEQLTAASDGESVDNFLSKIREEIGEILFEDHLRVLRAVSARDAAEAERAMAAHMDRVLAFLDRTDG
ncbi:MAG: FCD domain-containing protein [Synergistaceae bacterium]|nr:FCD domain-containing protein [Synergistaceae bacterium]